MFQNLKKKNKKYYSGKEHALLEKRIKALEEGQKRILSILRLAFPPPTEMETDAFLKHCERNGLFVIDEWNRRKKLEDEVTNF